MRKLFLAILLFSVPSLAQNWEKKVQVKISMSTSQGQFNDALYFTDAEYAKLTKVDIDKMVQTRADAWVKFVEEQSSKPPYVPTKEELIEQTDRQADEISHTVTQFVAAKPSKVEAQARTIPPQLPESTSRSYISRRSPL